MTGREFIVYILLHRLEDVDIFEDGNVAGFMNEDEAAAKYGVGPATIRMWHDYGALKGIRIGNSLYFPRDAEKEDTNEE